MTPPTDLDLLITRLKDAGVSPVDDLDGLLQGAAAAPTDAQDRWLELAYPDADTAQKSALTKAGRTYMDRISDPFTLGPAPAERLEALRAEMRKRNLTVLMVPRTDEFQGEYLPKRAERVWWLTGFSGSAGSVIVGLETAAIFVDGRYTLQVRDQVDTRRFVPHHLIDMPPSAWIAQNCGPEDRIGFDPWLHSQQGAGQLAKTAKKVGAALVRVEGNPIDAVWTDQPAAPLAPIVPQKIAFAGESAAQKRARLGQTLKEAGIDAAVITATDSIAWMLNMRGADVPNCPLSLSFAILNSDGSVAWFLDERKLTREARNTLDSDVLPHPIETFADALERLAAAGKTVQADPAGAPCAIFDRLMAKGATMREAQDPCLLPKACKNAVELQGTRAAHKRDGAAVSRFLKWLAEEAPKGGLDELRAIDHLYRLRAEGDHFRGLSFDTIAGTGPNGAIIHYRASEDTNRRIETGHLLLVDSGGQYLDGTTDITRTIAIGTPSDEMRHRFTLVLKGHIAIATARFPEGANGSQLDTLARHPLWQAGLDFDHGTGHGVGSYLNVHEGPQRIAKGHNPVALMPGMILSNEPGYYKSGAYGIRIENLVVVKPVETPPEGAERRLLEFETLTLAPYDRRLIETQMMTKAEIAWVNAYHARVLEAVGPQLNAEEQAWLKAATAPL